MHGQHVRRVEGFARRFARAASVVAVLALGLTLSGCDKCGDFFWHRQPGSCHATPDPN